jgi:hypothetical protein
MESTLCDNNMPYQKQQYKRFSVDFYKETGHMPSMNMLQLKAAAPSKTKQYISHFIVCIGMPVQVKYKIKESANWYNHEVTLSSGDALVIDQRIKEMHIQVSVVKATLP